MRLGFGEVFADAGTLWRGGPQLLIAVASAFFFLPAFANQLFIPPMVADGQGGDAFVTQVTAYLQQHFMWFAARFVIESMGVGVLMLLLLDPARPSVADAMARGLRILPGLLAARLIASLAVTLGWMILFVPGLYLMGRTFLTSAVFVAEPHHGPANAAVTGFQRTRDKGWLLFLIVFTPWILSALVAGIPAQMALTAKDASPFALAPLHALTAAIMAACMLLAVLLEAACYRALPPDTGPRTGM